MPAQVEAELKLRADDEASLDELATTPSLGGLVLSPARTIEETDVYLDTDDGRLAARRWACRRRTREGRSWISLKGPAEHLSGDPLHRRPELEGPIGDPRHPAGWPPSAARDMLVSMAGDQPLVERLTLQQRRTERSVGPEGAQIGTLSLDRVEVVQRGERRGTMRIVELEFRDEAPRPLVERLFSALASVPGLTAEPASKLERALGMLDRAEAT